MDLGHPRLSRLLAGISTPGSKTLSRACSNLERNEASDLLIAYLLDEADTVMASVENSEKERWGSDTLVDVYTVFPKS